MKYDYTWSPKGRDGKSLFDFEFEVECSVFEELGEPCLEIEDVSVGGQSLTELNVMKPAWMYKEDGITTLLDALHLVVHQDADFNQRVFENEGWRLIGGGNDPDTRWVREH